MNTNDPLLQIKLLNLDKITHSTLKYFFNSNLCNNATIAKSLRADMLIIDTDREKNLKDIITTLKQKQQLAIFLYSTGFLKRNFSNVQWLLKPIKPEQLINKINAGYKQYFKQDYKLKYSGLKKIKNKPKSQEDNHNIYLALNEETKNEKITRYKAHKTVGSKSDIDPDLSGQTLSIYLTPEKYLYHYLIKAKKLAYKEKINTILQNRSCEIYYEFNTDRFYFDLNHSSLKKIQVDSNFITTNVYVLPNKFPKFSSEYICIDSQSLIWESSIYASRGRIPVKTNILDKVEMKFWPNYSKLLLFRYVTKISALWSQNYLSLIETAKHLNIPQRYVFTLYCAMNAIECAQVKQIEITNVINTKHKNQSLFSRLLLHFSK